MCTVEHSGVTEMRTLVRSRARLLRVSASGTNTRWRVTYHDVVHVLKVRAKIRTFQAMCCRSGPIVSRILARNRCVKDLAI